MRCIEVATPAGGPPLLRRLKEEAADVTASLTFVSQVWGMDIDHVKKSASIKLALFQEWHADTSI